MREKRVIRLTEGDLHRIVKESVKRVIKENGRRASRRRMNEQGGDVSWRGDDGVARTTSKSTYRGVPGSRFIWHGEWSDPEIEWDGELINYNEFEDNLWYMFRSDTGLDSEQAFEEWINQEGGTDFLARELDDYLMALNN